MPVLQARLQIEDLIRRYTDQAATRVTLAGGQELPIPTFPITALDEALTNAFVHRDWLVRAPIQVTQTPSSIEITSPGGLPDGVQIDRLLSIPSQPRNLCLMRAMARLGLVEESSRGFDRMWMSCLLNGRELPEVEATEKRVTVTLLSSDVDSEFIRSVTKLRSIEGEEAASSLDLLLYLKYFRKHDVLSLETAASIQQKSAVRTRGDITEFVRLDYLDPISANEWKPGSRLLPFLSQRQPQEALTLRLYILHQVQANQAITARQIADARGYERTEVTGTLRDLRDENLIRIAPNGPQRGPGVRWIQA